MTCSNFCIKHIWECICLYILYLILKKLFDFICWFSVFSCNCTKTNEHLFIFFLTSDGSGNHKRNVKEKSYSLLAVTNCPDIHRMTGIPPCPQLGST